MKSLDSLLHSLRLKSAVQNRVVLNEPWGVTFPSQTKTGTFHYLETGQGILTVPGFPPVALEQGDLAIVFTDSEHTVQDITGTRPTELLTLLKHADVLCTSGLSLQFGGNGAMTSVLSGNFVFEDAATHPLWRILPPYILLKGENGQAISWLQSTLTLLTQESMEIRPGAMAVLDRLCDVLFIQALRGWVRTDNTAAGLPAAVKDPAIDEALDLLQRSPAASWTVEKLASQVALSRSTLAERFHRLTGDTPMEYLTHWRMHLAAQRLYTSQESVAAIAQQVGYESEAAFAKAFKRKVGLAPGAYRRQRNLSPAIFPVSDTSVSMQYP